MLDSLYDPRRVTNWRAAFRSHCDADPDDPKFDPTKVCFLSAFVFAEEMRSYLATEQYPKAVCPGAPDGWACRADWAWIDIDRKGNLPVAVTDVRRIAAFVLEESPGLSENALFVAFSGSKGFHLGVPLPWNPPASTRFPDVCKAFALGIARDAAGEGAAIPIDTEIYESVRCFRAPNSRHEKTQLYKRPLALAELMGLSADGIVELAREPAAADLAWPTTVPSKLRERWSAAEAEASVKAIRPTLPLSFGGRELNRSTQDFLSGEEIPEGERATRVYRAAGDIRERLENPLDLIRDLLFQRATDLGLSPKEADRQIRCGIESTERKLGLNHKGTP